ncbi:hypothetical protein TSAR_000255 [Trichomalopsis sarcophagae]|uniref:Serum response factor homolog n=1 Tax=Trichomalopsis sarcophagae TaxID=543379 RepID=A0A232EQV3_9HYME|nr:hypothetical protein TSAR_000255 [Trichomalopsis sarcophagae]
MDQSSSARDIRYANLGYGLGMMGSDTVTEIYSRPSTSHVHSRSNNGSGGVTGNNSDSAGSLTSGNVNIITQTNAIVDSTVTLQRGMKRPSTDICYDEDTSESQQVIPQTQTLNITGACITNNTDETYTDLGISKKSPPSNGKKTKGRVKIKMEYIDNKLRRYTTFSKRKTGIMKKAYELSTLTGTQVMLLVASETGHVYTFATRKLQPMITSEAGKALIQTCLNSPDPPTSGSSGDQRMSATGFEETELTYNIADDEQKVRQMVYGSPHGSGLHVGYSNTGGPLNSQHTPTSHGQHTHLIAHAHGSAQSSHLVPCSSPSPMLSGSPYVQSCPSPLPPPHGSYHPHMSHSHNQR